MVAFSVSGLLWISNDARACGNSCSGTNCSPVFASWNTAWRWLNVPRSTSSPVSRIGMPSARMVANASSSAVAQSTVRSSALASTRAPLLAAAFELLVEREAVAARVSSASLISRSRSSGTPVCALPATPGGAGSGIGATKSSSGLSAANACSSTAKCFFTSAVGRLRRQRALLDQRVRRSSSRTVGCAAIVLYITGCVNAGSSPSLWP